MTCQWESPHSIASDESAWKPLKDKVVKYFNNNYVMLLFALIVSTDKNTNIFLCVKYCMYMYNIQTEKTNRWDECSVEHLFLPLMLCQNSKKVNKKFSWWTGEQMIPMYRLFFERATQQLKYQCPYSWSLMVSGGRNCLNFIFVSMSSASWNKAKYNQIIKHYLDDETEYLAKT